MLCYTPLINLQFFVSYIADSIIPVTIFFVVGRKTFRSIMIFCFLWPGCKRKNIFHAYLLCPFQGWVGRIHFSVDGFDPTHPQSFCDYKERRGESSKCTSNDTLSLFLLLDPTNINTPPTIHIFQKQTFMDNKTFKKGVAGRLWFVFSSRLKTFLSINMSVNIHCLLPH